MLTFEEFVRKLRKELRDNYQSIGDSMIAGGAKDMEQYKYLLGQAHAYQSIDGAVSEILNPKSKEKEDEQQNDNVIGVDFGRNTEE